MFWVFLMKEAVWSYLATINTIYDPIVIL